MECFMMALDQGTTSSRCILFDKKGNMRSVAQKEFTQHYPVPGWVEHDAEEIWQTQIEVAKEAMQQINASPKQIAAIGITNQRETTIVWDKATGKPIHPAIVWQCRRTADLVEELKEKGLGNYINETTGLIPDAYFSATKVAWILDHVEGSRERAENGELLFGTVDSWLIWNLTGGKVHVTDYTNASRTMLFDIRKLDWDDTILEELKISRKMLPEVKASSCLYGYTIPSIFGEEIPIAGAAGDQQAALFGQCCWTEGEVKNTYGTGCFMLMNTGNTAVRSAHGLVTTIAAGVSGQIEYALEGSIFVAGAAIQWLRDELKVIETAAETEACAQMVEDTQGAYVVPAFTGLGAPHWDQYARGAILGLTRGFNRNHLIRATLESLCYQTYDVLKVMEQDSNVSLKNLKVDGGACANNFLMQFQADILGTTVLRPNCIETTALGAAYLAGLEVGFWKNKEEILENWGISREFKSEMTEERRQELVYGWTKAVKGSFNWVEK